MKNQFYKLSVVIMVLVFCLSLFGCGGGGGGSDSGSSSSSSSSSSGSSSSGSSGSSTSSSSSSSGGSSSPWSVKQNGNILEIAYRNGTEYLQIAAFHLDSGYFRLISLLGGWGSSVVVTPSFWKNTVSATWESVSPPGYMRKLICYNNDLYALTIDNLYKSTNNGNTWQQIPINLLTSDLNFIDIDQDKIYIACKYGIVVSENLNGNFTWSFHWMWDPCTEVNMQDGYGWCLITNWGSRSGVNRKTPDGDWILVPQGTEIPGIDPPTQWDSVSSQIAVNPNDPYNIVFIGNGLTTDSYVHYQLSHPIALYTIWNGILTAFGAYEYTDDLSTWRTHGLNWVSIMTKGPDNLLYANDFSHTYTEAEGVVYHYGIFRGGPNEWEYLGFDSDVITSIAVNDNYVFAGLMVGSPSNPDPDNLRRGTISSSKVYHQGTPVTVTWQEQGSDLLINYSGTIFGLSFEGTILLNPPTENSTTATVNVTTSGDIDLADNPNQAFKPLMLSSMKISDNSWDCNGSFIGSSANSIPADQWLVPNPITDTVFGLKGGSSDWKQNAPTTTITLGTAMPITGWVTPTNDPNDDNIGMWPASDTVLRSWNYTITASKQE